MKYIKDYSSFNGVNEEFIGKLFKGLKNKLSLGFSKMFGSAAAVEKVMAEYKKEVMAAGAKKKAALSAYAAYVAAVKNGGDANQAEAAKLEANVKTASTNYDKQIELIKQKFDIKFNEIVKEEDNEKIKNFITLKKIEMQQELLEAENKVLLTDAGLTEADVKSNPAFMQMLKSINDKATAAQKLADEQKKALEAKEAPAEKEAGFDLAKAKADKNYLWPESPFSKNYKFKSGEEVKYWSNTDAGKQGAEYSGSTAYVGPNDGLGPKKDVANDSLYITKQVNKPGFVVKKGKIISTANADKKAEEKAEEKK